MRRKLPLLRGLAILAVLVAHASLWAVVDLLPDAGAALDLHGWTLVQYRVLTSVEQLSIFAVPSFFFITGVFATYATRGSSFAENWPFIKTRLWALLVPLAIWSVVSLSVDAFFGIRNWPLYWVRALHRGGIEWGYYFVPALAQFYLLTPWLVRASIAHPRRVLAAVIVVQLLVIVLHLAGGPAPDSFIAAIPGVGKWPGGNYPAWRWILYFGLGILGGRHSATVEEWLKSHRRLLGAGALVFSGVAVLEGTLLTEAYRNVEWFLGQQRLGVTFAALSVIAYFLSLDIKSTARTRWIEKFGVRSFGIFLIHPIVMKGAHHVLGRVLPSLCQRQVMVMSAVFLVLGFALPWLAIEAVSRSRWKHMTLHLFGH
jgi:surface polysaccharide O-acyltransferase-like enzyme